MSSGTSTEPRESSEALQPWQLFTLAGLIGATAVVFVARDTTPSGIILLSLIVFGAAAVGVAAWRTFAPLAAEEDSFSTQAYGGRTRAALEREKNLVLRSIKELEFDRAMGKVSEKDFAEMGGRLRLRAARLLRELDAGTTYRDEIKQEIERRVGVPDAPRPATVACPHCGTSNDADAKFCKQCGASLESAE